MDESDAGSRLSAAADPHPAASVVVSARGVERFRAGHPWIYRQDVVAVGDGAPGSIVRIRGPRGVALGTGLYSERSRIAVRRWTVEGDPSGREDLWRTRLARADDYRRSLGFDTVYRVVHGEADLLPSLVVDRYGDYLVIQTLSQATDRLRDHLVGALVERFQPAGVVARNDPRVRELEGLARTVEVAYGDVPSAVPIEIDGVLQEVDLRHGQKTGLFLDQRENRSAAARHAHGRLLDAFSYDGGFTLRLARHCDSVVSLDSSEDAVARLRRNAALNAIGNVEARSVNVFDELRALDRRRERFDTIVLDPPAFAKTRSAVPRARAAYKEINLRALRLLAPDGVLVSCTCSSHVSEPDFLEIVRDAAADARVQVRLVEKRMQGRDHPVLLALPESGYLKCLVLRVLGSG